MCVLRASGEEFDVDAFVATTYLEPCNVYRRGEPRHPRSKPHGTENRVSGVTLDVSKASWERIADQIADAEQFLTLHQSEIQRLAGCAGVQFLTLDFPVDQRVDRNGILVERECFPASLLRLAGALGIEIELSIYRTKREEGAVEE